mmetsp:Transcript_30902/g.59645  ORF Transcript_30902/g.59645 Transcript_30902/m.59645 type:complete len:218 (-) Transcript_30902:99-752(-)
MQWGLSLVAFLALATRNQVRAPSTVPRAGALLPILNSAAFAVAHAPAPFVPFALWLVLLAQPFAPLAGLPSFLFRTLVLVFVLGFTFRGGVRRLHARGLNLLAVIRGQPPMCSPLRHGAGRPAVGLGPLAPRAATLLVVIRPPPPLRRALASRLGLRLDRIFPREPAGGRRGGTALAAARRGVLRDPSSPGPIDKGSRAAAPPHAAAPLPPVRRTPA